MFLYGILDLKRGIIWRVGGISSKWDLAKIPHLTQPLLSGLLLVCVEIVHCYLQSIVFCLFGFLQRAEWSVRWTYYEVLLPPLHSLHFKE